jgi:hypothetical protein
MASTVTVGLNSYVTADEAAEYLSRRLRTAAWDRADDITRAKALAHATLILEGLPWAGQKPTGQTLAFPRDDADEVPDAIKWAQAELALALLAYDDRIAHVVTTKAPLSNDEADAAAQHLRAIVGPDAGKVLVLGGSERAAGEAVKYDEVSYKQRAEMPEDFASCSSFHELPANVQNLIGDYVALGARLSR